MNGLLLVWCVALVAVGCAPSPGPTDLVEGWYFDTKAPMVFGVPRVRYSFNTTGPFTSKTECNRGVKYFLADADLMVLMEGQGFGECYMKPITVDELAHTSLRAP